MTLSNNELFNINGGCFIINFRNFAKVIKAVINLFRR